MGLIAGQVMLPAVLLSCALLLALPPMQGAQMGLAPLEGIRRPDQDLFPELPGQYGQGWSWVEPGYPLATKYPAWYEPSFPLPNPRPWRWVFYAWGGRGFCPHIIGSRPGPAVLAEKNNCRTVRSPAAGGRGFGRGNRPGKGGWPQAWEGRQASSPLSTSRPPPRVILQTTLSMLHCHPAWIEAGDIPGPAFRGPCLKSCSLTPVGTRSGGPRATLPASLRKAA